MKELTQTANIGKRVKWGVLPNMFDFGPEESYHLLHYKIMLFPLCIICMFNQSHVIYALLFQSLVTSGMVLDCYIT